MARPSKCRCICSMPQVTEFLPRGAVPEARESVVLQVDELEAIRLLDYGGLPQALCAARITFSRATVARFTAAGRRTGAQALVEGRGLRIEGGDVMICTSPRPECAGEPHCCHRQGKEG